MFRCIGLCFCFFSRLTTKTEQVNACLEIRSSVTEGDDTAGTVFTEDVLKIEICGPKEDYLTIIDVPGIFRNPHGIITRHDMAMVRSMVERYVRDRRTIIIAVLPSNVDIATQEILSLAEDHDPDGERTLGVFTKPDTVTERSGKNVICDLVLGRKKPLTLGYYVVRNRGSDEDPATTAAERELMFNAAPWDSLPRDRVGVAALKSQLTQLLSEITRREFGPLRQEVVNLQMKNQIALDTMGSPRETEQQQRVYLSSIAAKFQNLVAAALTCQYSQDSAFDKDPNLRLSTTMVKHADQLVSFFSRKGHVWKFEKSDEASPEDPHPDHPDHPDHAPAPEEFGGRKGDVSAADFDQDSIASLCELLPQALTFGDPKSGIKLWIGAIYQRYRGPELSSFGNAVLCGAFKEQSKRWILIAKTYAGQCIRIVHRFIRAVLNQVCPDGVDDEIWSLIADETIARYRVSMRMAIHLTHVETTLNPYTLSHYYSGEVQKARLDRLSKRLREICREPSGKSWSSNVVTIDLAALGQTKLDESNVDHVKNEIHDTLRAYYKVAKKRFLDNLYLQAVDYSLLNGDKSPLKVFSQEWVVGLNAEQLAMLVGDSARTKAQRMRLQTRSVDLEKAIKVLKG